MGRINPTKLTSVSMRSDLSVCITGEHYWFDFHIEGKVHALQFGATCCERATVRNAGIQLSVTKTVECKVELCVVPMTLSSHSFVRQPVSGLINNVGNIPAIELEDFSLPRSIELGIKPALLKCVQHHGRDCLHGDILLKSTTCTIVHSWKSVATVLKILDFEHHSVIKTFESNIVERKVRYEVQESDVLAPVGVVEV